jgi:hypothetical protein
MSVREKERTKSKKKTIGKSKCKKGNFYITNWFVTETSFGLIVCTLEKFHAILPLWGRERSFEEIKIIIITNEIVI